MAQNAIEIKVMERPSDSWELLVDGFLEYRRKDVPMSGVAGMHTAKGRENMTQVLKQMVQSINGPIIIAWDTVKQKVVGDIKARFIDREILKLEYKDQPGAYTQENMEWDEQTTEQLGHIMRFYIGQKKQLDIFSTYPEIDRYAEVYSCGVMEEYARRGLGMRLMQKVLEQLKEVNCKLVYGSFSNFFSQKVAEKCGFVAIIRKRYDEDQSLFNILPPAIRDIHEDDAIMIKWL